MRAVTWALYEVGPEEADVAGRLILLVLADNSNDEGRNAAVSKAELQKATGLGESTIYRRLRDLEKAGLIRAGDPRVVDYLPANVRPKVWDLPRVAKTGRIRAKRRKTGVTQTPQPEPDPAGQQQSDPSAPGGVTQTPQVGGVSGVSQGCPGGVLGVPLETHNSLDPLNPLDPLDPGGAGGGSQPSPAAGAARRPRDGELEAMRVDLKRRRAGAR